MLAESIRPQDAGYGIVQCLLSLSDAPVAAADAEAAANGGAVVSAPFGDVMEPGYAMQPLLRKRIMLQTIYYSTM